VPTLLLDVNGQESAYPYSQGSTVTFFAEGGTDIVVVERSLSGHWEVTLHGGPGDNLLIDEAGNAVLDGGRGVSLLDGTGSDRLGNGINIDEITDPEALGPVLDYLFVLD
jgi:hypothetical protein